jgi:major membrane immunogen (membrane-anchored lipoprotein)
MRFALLLMLCGMLLFAGCGKEGYQKRTAPPGEAKADAVDTRPPAEMPKSPSTPAKK